MKSNNKSLIMSFILCCVLIIILSACGSGDSSTTKASDNDSKTFTFKYNSILPQSDNETVNYYLMDRFAEELEKRSDGRIKIDMYYNSQLVSPPEIIHSLETGIIDFAITAPQYYGDTIPEGFLAMLPFWAESMDRGYYFMRETDLGELFHDSFYENGAKPLAHTITPSIGFMLNKPIETVDDLKGMVLRASGGMINTWYNELGISGSDIPIMESYDALQRGVVDGNFGSFAGLEIISLGEVVDYIVEPVPLDAQVTSLFMSRSAWESLPEDLQELVMEVSLEMELKETELIKKDAENIKNVVDQYNIEVINLSETEYRKLFESAMPVWDEFASKSDNSAGIIEVIRSEHEMLQD